MHLRFSVMHGSFHLGQSFTELICNLSFGSRNEALEGVQYSDLPLPFGLVKNFLEVSEDQPSRLGWEEFDNSLGS